MDNLCHTLAGGALARTGLARRTALGTATLLIGANLPDVDALAGFYGPATMLEVRRGWTHGILAMAAWPFILTGLMLAWDRWVRRRRHPGAAPAHARSLLVLSLVGVLSHPLLDLLNTYGVRWLMPFSGRWFYGDTLFIVDPWVWIVLGFGLIASGRRWRTDRPRPGLPATAALAIVIGYAGAMRLVSTRAERVAAAAVEEIYGEPVSEVLASPGPVLPLTRRIVASVPGGYRVGTVAWRPRPTYTPMVNVFIPFGPLDDPEVQWAAEQPDGRKFLAWARFPFVEVERSGATTEVHFVDARYSLSPGVRFGSITVRLPPAGTVTASAAPPPSSGSSPPASRAGIPAPRP